MSCFYSETEGDSNWTIKECSRTAKGVAVSFKGVVMPCDCFISAAT